MKKLFFLLIFLLSYEFNTVANDLIDYNLFCHVQNVFNEAPKGFPGSMDSDNKLGFDLGGGWKINLTSKFKVLFGFHYYTKAFDLEYHLPGVNAGGEIITVDVTEKFELKYFGIYLKEEIRKKSITLGMGLDISFSKGTSIDYKYYDQSGSLISERNTSGSTINYEFNQQVDGTVYLGYELLKFKNIVLRSIVQLSMTIRPVLKYDFEYCESSNIIKNDLNHLSLYMFKFGFDMESQ